MLNIAQTVICASKYFTAQEMHLLYQKGVRHFGENRAQDLISKKDVLGNLEITWHFIGHLQTNKVKLIINHIDYLHTLDSIKLAKTIQSHAATQKNCFIQVNLTEEPQKYGILPINIAEFLKEIANYDKIKIIGFMTIGKENDVPATEHAFIEMKALQDKYQTPFLSMGMTEDYELAIKHGATHVRLGRKFKALLE